jgi:MFS family permease
MGVHRRIRASPLHVLAASLFALRLGSAMTMVGLPLLILHRYGAGLNAGITLALEVLPNVVFGPLVGGLVDRSDPRKFAIAGPLLAAPFIVLLPLTDAMWQLQSLASLIGVGYLVGLPARLALRSCVIPAGTESSGNGVLSAAQRLSTLLGPAIAALLIPVGYPAVFLVAAACTVMSALFLLGLSVTHQERTEPQAPGPRGPGVFRSIPGVLRSVAADRVLSALAITALTYSFALGITTLFMAAYSLSRFPHDAGIFGLLTAAMGAGAVIGSVSAPRFTKVSQGRLYVAVNVLEGGCWLSMIFYRNPVEAAIAVAAAGACEAMGTVVFYAEAQTRLPAGFQGRFFGFLIPATDAFSLLGTVTAGVVAAAGVTSAAVIMAAAMVLPVVALCPLFLRRSLWQPAASGEGEDAHPFGITFR